MNVTAVVLSAGRYARRLAGLEVLHHRSFISDAQQLQRARFDALLKVRTEHFFFLDDDDDLPHNYLQVLARCVEAGAPLVYTDEIVCGERFSRRPYSRAVHLSDPQLVHHLALYRTSAAREAVSVLPIGHYAPEVMLAWQVAKGGAEYLPEVGYIWNRSPGGMHSWPCTSLSQVRALLWAKANP